MNRSFGIVLVLLALAALALRGPALGLRPMHNDEAVNAQKLRELWEKGVYRYDPHEYHGPVLYYASLPAVWLSRARDYGQWREATLRLVPVLFGVGLILLLWLQRDGVGQGATLGAAALLAISPAMVFYSRYFVHEMLLVFFTALLIAAGWRYSRTRRIGWALLAGAAAGLMYATKETFVFSLAALAGALVLTRLCGRRLHAGDHDPQPRPGTRTTSLPLPTSPALSCSTAPEGERRAAWNWRHGLAALGTGLAVAVVFFTSFFTNLTGALDALRTYLPWMERAGGASPHIHPWWFYLERLLWFHHGRGPVYTEGFILVLALIGWLACLRRSSGSVSGSGLVRFLGFYSILLGGAYSVVPYKTPWCLLGFWYAVIVVAGVGAAVVLRWQPRRWLRAVLSAVLVLGAAHLVWQTLQTSYVIPAERRNPYAYAQTSPDILELVDKIQALARVHPQGDQMWLNVIASDQDYWPLPWYLRRLTRVGWWSELPPDPPAPVTVINAALRQRPGATVEKTHTMTGIYGLRPQVFLELYVEESLWQRYMARRLEMKHN
jgi:uncharacterized protein (TIGR03663 family)